jgi:hypothetical protein
MRSPRLCRGRRDGIYPESMFRYQPESDTFLCPAGQLMKMVGLVSLGDLVKWVISAQAATIEALQKYITGDYPA